MQSSIRSHLCVCKESWQDPDLGTNHSNTCSFKGKDSFYLIQVFWQVDDQPKVVVQVLSVVSGDIQAFP